MKRLHFSAAVSIYLLFATNIVGEDFQNDRNAPPNLQRSTWGGTQLWTDEFVHDSWHIQRHALTGHYRLLDGKDVRQAWGTYEQCRDKFEELRIELNIPPMRKDVVLVLHGLGGHRSLMDGICDVVRGKENYSCINVAYASTRGDLNDHAEALSKVIENLQEVERIHFVAHSIGNLVIRQYFTNLATQRDDCRRHPEFGRFVMLGPPNRGAQFAERVHLIDAITTILGPGIQDLTDTRRDPDSLAVPPCEFAIVAGGRSNGKGINPLINGDDDLMVSVEETRLPGARDFIVLPIRHRLLVSDPQVHQLVVTFLQHGYFVDENRRQPLTDE